MRNSKAKIIVSLLWLVIWCCFNKIVAGLHLTGSRELFSLLIEGFLCILIAQIMCYSRKLKWLVLCMLTILLICQFNIVSLLSYLINLGLFVITWQMGPMVPNVFKSKKTKGKVKKIKLANGHVLR